MRQVKNPQTMQKRTIVLFKNYSHKKYTFGKRSALLLTRVQHTLRERNLDLVGTQGTENVQIDQ